MRRGWVMIVFALALVAGLPSLAVAAPFHAAAAAPANSRVSRDSGGTTSYLRYNGTADEVTRDCSHGRRAQNEPAVAVDPHNTHVVVAGANDYCTAIHTGDVWAGYYRSTDGGATWRDSLVPGYPGDTSPAGLASPTHGTCAAAGDPTQ